MSKQPTRIIGVACSIFREEIEALRELGEIEIPFRYLDSMMHMCPNVLESSMEVVLTEEQKRGRGVLALYGDCHPRMVNWEQQAVISRTTGLNCCEILLGGESYRRLRSERVFFLLPEWAKRWKTVFRKGLGLTADNARDLMGEMHTRLVYLDTGLVPVPEEHLRSISEFTGLPWEVLKVSLEPLLSAIREAQRRCSRGRG
jgi:hypothetical protein